MFKLPKILRTTCPRDLSAPTYFFLLLATCGAFTSPKSLADSFDDYLEEIRSISKRAIPPTQVAKLREFYDSVEQTELTSRQLAARHKTFTASTKSKLRQAWKTHASKSPWPKYATSVRCKVNNQTVCLQKGWYYDMHHIIPQSYNGPHAWWNVFPLSRRQHTKVHASDSTATELFPNSAGVRLGGY